MIFQNQFFKECKYDDKTPLNVYLALEDQKVYLKVVEVGGGEKDREKVVWEGKGEGAATSENVWEKLQLQYSDSEEIKFMYPYEAGTSSIQTRIAGCQKKEYWICYQTRRI